MRCLSLSLVLALAACTALAQDTQLGKRGRAGVYLDGLFQGPMLQGGYRLSPHAEATLTVGIAPRRRSVAVDTDDPRLPFTSNSFSRAFVDAAVTAGVHLSVRETGAGLYLRPSVQYLYFSAYSDAYRAALAEEPSRIIRRTDPEGRRLEDRSYLALGSEAGYRFHFLRLLYADVAGTARARFGNEDDGTYELSARIGLGVRF